MPVKIYLEGGLSFSAKGDTEREAINTRLLSPWALVVNMGTGHLLKFRKRAIMLTDPQTQAEADRLEAEQKEKAEAQKKEQDEARAKAEVERKAALN